MRWSAALILSIAVLGGRAGVPARGPLHIRSEVDLYGIAQGFGTVDSPFVVEGLRIDANGAPFGILIANFGRPLILRNLEVYGASIAAIRLQNVQNLRIERVVARGSVTGVFATSSRRLVIQESRVENCQSGVRLMFCEEIVLQNNVIRKAEVGVWFQGTRVSTLTRSRIQECGLGLLLELESTGNVVTANAFLENHVHGQSEGRNHFDDGKRGNFWEGFAAEDVNSDGIWDQAYYVGADVDRFPLVFPP